MRKRIRGAIVTLAYTAALLLAVSAANVSMEAAVADGVSVPIIMYHSVLRDESRAGKYIITEKALERDLAYLKNSGYNTVFVRDLAAYVYDGVSLPSNPIVLTFDDGHYNNLTYVLPLLEKYDMVACVSIVGAYSQRGEAEEVHSPGFSYCTLDEVSELAASGRVEIVNHSFDMHSTDGARKGAKQRAGESEAQYREALEADALRNQELLRLRCAVTPTCYAYPFGLYTRLSEEILRDAGFTATLTCREKLNRVSGPDSLYALGRYNRDGSLSTEEFMRRVGI
ncbi:MAG: polysaccharide deacetylase family protein [Clostridia bacterium]|nr:polysaccharide deacetylase family protein [Clostridia bacterium]